MSQRSEQAFNDGRLAFRAGKDGRACSRRSLVQRAEWMRGYEHEHRLDVAATITPAQEAESAQVIGKLKAWARENLK